MPLPAAVPIILSALGTAASVGAQAAGNRKRYEQQTELARWQNEMNLAQWQRENQYNSPVEQMKRLRAAGLNPQLYAPGGNTSASSPTLVTPEAQSYSHLQGIAPGVQNTISAMQTAFQLQQQEQNIELTKQEARLKKLQADAYESGDFFGGKASQVWQGITESNARIEKLQTDVVYRHQQAKQITAQIELYNKQAENIDSQINLREYQVVEILDRIDYRAVQESLMRSQMLVNQGKMTLMDAQTEAVLKGLNLTDAQITNLGLTGLGLQQDIADKYQGLGGSGAVPSIVRLFTRLIFSNNNGIYGGDYHFSNKPIFPNR